jgi:hypothetical protein
VVPFLKVSVLVVPTRQLVFLQNYITCFALSAYFKP